MPILKPGTFKIGEISLFSEVTGVQLPLDGLAQILEINIYENMFADSVTCNILVSDSNNLIANLPIVGNEKVKVVFYGSSEGEKEDRISLDFKLYSMDAYSKDNIGASTYILNFTSEEYIESCNSIISKSFSSLTVSEIVSRIYSGLNSKKKIEIEETDYLHNLIIPSMKPFDSLNWLTKYAKSKGYNGANYLFFETLTGYNFKSLESFVDILDDDIYGTYYNIPPKVNPVHSGEYYLIGELRIKKTFNIMKNILDGLYSSRAIVHDIIRRTKTNMDFNYVDSYGDYKHVEYNKRPGGQRSTMILPEKLSESDSINYIENPGANLSVIPKHSNLFSSSGRDYNSKRDVVSQIRKSQMAQLSNLGLEVVIEGDLKIRCGNVVSIMVPSSQSSSGSWLWDPYLSGRYLVTGIRHSFSAGKHATVLVLNRDSNYTPIDSKSKVLDNIFKGVE
tara:strand:+ start:9949 stop:11295 length:1347 start_codon:yes stop_codon:yes gene_type:complete